MKDEFSSGLALLSIVLGQFYGSAQLALSVADQP